MHFDDYLIIMYKVTLCSSTSTTNFIACDTEIQDLGVPHEPILETKATTSQSEVLPTTPIGTMNELNYRKS